MRLRHIHNGKEILDSNPRVITAPEKNGNKLENIFNNSNPVHIELGSGKGLFIREISKRNPEINYFGIEASTKVIFKWLPQIEEAGDRGNYFIVHSKAEMVGEIFSEHSVERIYLNFSDPWPKLKHARRRLTSPMHLDAYENILVRGGELILKTDNQDLFQYSINTLKKKNWTIKYFTFDLYHSEYIQNNIATEYEMMFVEEGKTICMLTASLNDLSKP
ncbi:MAG: tRNA (Guanine46-N7-)-methyltransferase [Clostridiales bacterium 38_11]|nr:MAG: tRNA (Guanine46-N7-)-methyltransferase [Clostridiales bacterium 38_11]